MKGYAQIPSVDFLETFAPVVRFDMMRTFLALATNNGWLVGFSVRYKIKFP